MIWERVVILLFSIPYYFIISFCSIFVLVVRYQKLYSLHNRNIDVVEKRYLELISTLNVTEASDSFLTIQPSNTSDLSTEVGDIFSNATAFLDCLQWPLVYQLPPFSGPHLCILVEAKSAVDFNRAEHCLVTRLLYNHMNQYTL